MYTLYGKSYTSIVIKPMGSFSEIIDMVNKTSYKLYEKMMMKVMNRYFLPKTGNKKLFVQALHLFLE